MPRVLCAGIRCLAPRFIGHKLSEFTSDMGKTQREIGQGQPRFISPERGLMQLAQCAILNAIWDLWAKCEKKPVWKLVADMTPEELVRCVDFRYLSEVITPNEMIERLTELAKTKDDRMQKVLESRAVPGYSTSIGWLGYCESSLKGLYSCPVADEKIAHELQKAIDQGFMHFKLKVGVDLEDDKRRLGLIRRIAGDAAVIMVSRACGLALMSPDRCERDMGCE